MAGLINWTTNFVSESDKTGRGLYWHSSVGAELSRLHRLLKGSCRNPLCFTIPMGKFTYYMKTGGREIASGVIEDPGSLTARATTWLDVGVTIPFDILLSLMKDVAEDWDIDYELEVRLIIDILCCDIPIPVRNTGTMKLPTMSSIADFL